MIFTEYIKIASTYSRTIFSNIDISINKISFSSQILNKISFKSNWIVTEQKLSRLVNWLRVPTPMRAIRVRDWVEVVGSVMEFISFPSSMQCKKKNFFSRHLAWKAESLLSEDELSCKVLGPAVYIRRYIAEFNKIQCCSSQYSGKNRVTLTMKRIEAGRQFPMIKQLPWQLAVNRGAVGESRTSGRRGKTPWGKPVSAINTVRKSQAALRYHIWRTSPAYSCSSTSSWPMSRLYPVLCLEAISRLGKWAPGG